MKKSQARNSISRRSSVKALAWTIPLLSSPALAQNVSDLQPPPPPAPAGGLGGQGRYWIPGMPAPITGGASVNNPLNANGTIKSEVSGQPAQNGPTTQGRGEVAYSASDLDGEMRVTDPHAGENAEMPETHRVKKGDTLWDISSLYFQNPWYWPKLWALNPLITNPHWIYPGDVVRLRAAGEAPPPPASGPPANLPVVRIERPADRGINLRQTGFVEQGDLKASAQIMGSREEKVMLTALDECYLEYPRDKPLIQGQRYSIYRVVSDVKSPGSKSVLGSIVEIVGEVEVTGFGERNLAKGKIVEAQNPIERGFRVGPLRRRFEVVEPVPGEENREATVLATIRPQALLGEAMLAFIDRGKDDGIKVGNRLMVIRRGDGIQPLRKQDKFDDKRFPREVYGEVLVLDVRGKTSTTVVTRSIKEVVVGDHLELRRGY